MSIASALEQIEDIIQRIGEAFVPFTSGFSEITYRAVNLQLNGKFSLDKTTLLKRLKTNLQKQTVEIVLGCGQTITRLSEFPDYPCLFTYLQLKLPEGKLMLLHTESFTVITTSFKFLPFWETFVSCIHNGDSARDGF